MANYHGTPDEEETPLLGRKSKTPLPWGQITLAFVALITEPISSVYILPFINQVSQHLFLHVQHLTLNDERFISLCKKAHRRARHHWRRRSQDWLLCRSHRRGEYVHRNGAILIFAQESLFFVTQALTTWQWSRLSDFIGRRPVILLGLLGLSVSNFAFGLSRTLGTLIIRSVKLTTYPRVD